MSVDAQADSMDGGGAGGDGLMYARALATLFAYVRSRDDHRHSRRLEGMRSGLG